jgi:hypothetical protein
MRLPTNLLLSLQHPLTLRVFFMASLRFLDRLALSLSAKLPPASWFISIPSSRSLHQVQPHRRYSKMVLKSFQTDA